MRWRTVAVALFACATVDVAAAQGPSLADLSKKEAERRKGTPTPHKAYTNKDVPASALKDPRAAIPGEGGTPAAAQNAAEPPPKQPEGRDESWWRGRMEAAREELRRNEAFQEALQSRINSLSADILARDDPYQRAKLGEDRGKAGAEMARVTAEVAKGKKAIEDLEEEARKAGVPPGWLR